MKRHNLFRILFFLILLTSLCCQPAKAQPQEQITLSSVAVNLFPELNHPRMLVILEIELDKNTPLPSELIFQIPVDAHTLIAASRTENNELLPIEDRVSQEGNWQDMRFKPITHQIQIEYFDPNLVKQGESRIFEYQWHSIYPVVSLSMMVRQPYGSSPISTDPPLKESLATTGSTAYYSEKIGAVPAGELFTLSLMYTKNTANLAYPAVEVDAAVAINETTLGRTPSPLSVVMWLLLAALGILILVSFYYWRFRANVLEKRERTVQGVGIMNPEKQVVFCHECGMRSRAADSFCSNCGTELRRPTRF